MWLKSWSVPIQMEATEKHFPVVLVYYTLQGGSNCRLLGEILKCDHLNESYWAVLSCGAGY